MHQGEKSLSDEDREFRRYYSLHLKPLEQRFESLRLESVKETKLRVIAALTAWLVTVVTVGYLSPLGDGFTTALLIALALMAGIGLGLWAWTPTQAHIDQLKEQILPRIISFFGDLRYQSEPDFEPRYYHDWKVLPVFDESYVEDQIEGKYNDVSLKLAEVKLRYRKTRSSAGNSVTEHITKFEGMMIVFELERNYPGVTLFRSQDSKMIEPLDETLTKVNMGSGFEVFMTNDAPREKLADAQFLTQLAEVARRFEARHLFASLHSDQLVMLIWHKGDYFEMSHRQKTNFAIDAERVREQLQRIFSIVELLNVNGLSGKIGKESVMTQHRSFTKPPEINESLEYESGSWGCLIFFVMYAFCMIAFLLLLEAEWLLWWSAAGGLLMSSGLYQSGQGIRQRSVLTMIIGFILLSGAFMVLYFYLSPNLLELIGPWFLFN